MKVKKPDIYVLQTYNHIFTSEKLLTEQWKSLKEINPIYKQYMKDKYRNLYNYENYYVSNLGRIAQKDIYQDLIILPVYKDIDDSLSISIHSYRYRIQTLVAYLFVDNDDPLNKKFACKIDITEKSNNEASNIYWGTYSDVSKNRKPRAISSISHDNIVHSNKEIHHTNEPIVKLSLNNEFVKLYLNSTELKNDNIKNANNITRQCRENQQKNICNAIKEGYKWMFLSHYNSVYVNNKIDLDLYIKSLKYDNVIIKTTTRYKIIAIYKSIYDILNDGYNLSNIIKCCDTGNSIKVNNKQTKFMYLKDYLTKMNYNSIDDILGIDYK